MDGYGCVCLQEATINNKTLPQSSQSRRREIQREKHMVENEITDIIIGCAIKVHKKLGPGLLESAYEECLYHELKKTKLIIERQKPLPVVYDEIKLECGYRMDIVADKKVIVEIKSVEGLNDIHMAQILTYLRLSGCKVGLLINFNVVRLIEGIKRVVNNY